MESQEQGSDPRASSDLEIRKGERLDKNKVKTPTKRKRIEEKRENTP